MTIEAQQEKLSFQAEVKQLLDIVVHSLYSNKEIFLRELISNASDAIDKLRFKALTDSALYESEPDLRVRVRFDQNAKTITISDNGIGMSRDDVIENLGTIAKSGTREFLSRLTGDQKKDSHLIGQFGVGFYSSFIVADKVTVHSRLAGLAHEHGVCWESTGNGEYTVANLEKTTRGTDIILHLKEDQDEFLNEWRLRSVITKYSDHLNLPIQLPKYTDDGKETADWETVNRATALWAQPKSAVTEEQYHDFYKHIAHDFEAPLAYTHHKVEGGHIDYTCLLFIPQHAPFDLWQRDSHNGLKLYVQRVFIMDKVEQFLPHYLRFMKGVLDTTALPLNISREILQDHPVIPKLRSALVRHSLDMLERIANDDQAKYTLFWSEFGNVLKEGPAEDFANRERIAKLFRFSSTHTEDNQQSVSLMDYVGRMKPTQQKIYFITADHLQAARFSPHLEIFRKNNIEVLLLTDKIDEWVVSHLPEFDGKPLQSVAKGDLSADELSADANAQENEEQKHEQQQAYEALLTQMKSVLGNKIKEVRLSERLTTSPSCLVRDQSAIGPQMERLLKAAGQPVDEVKPILELNPDHVIIQKLKMSADQDKLADWTYLLYDQALLAEGGNIADPAAFVQRMNKLWLQSL